VVLFLGLPFFFYGGPGYHSPRSFKAAWDLGHVLFFTLATVWAFTFMRARVQTCSFFRLFFIFSSIILCFGALIEFLQVFRSNRLPDIFDVLRNQLGCMLAFAFYVQPRKFEQSRIFSSFFQVIALILLLCALTPFTRAVIDEQVATRQFPLLADFETPFELDRWGKEDRVVSETSLVKHGNKAMRAHFSTAKYSGTTLFYFPENWRGYNTLHLSVYNPQTAEFPLNLRINDLEHKQHGARYADRFNKRFPLHPGWNDLVVNLDQVRNAPKNRKMNMEHITGFGLFVVQQPKPLDIIIDHIFLSR